MASNAIVPSYSDSDRARVKALMMQGHGSPTIATLTGFPERTVAHWMMRWREIAAQEGDRELLDRDYRVAIRSDELIHDAYDYIAQDETGERAAKNLIALNAVRGTAIDKLIKRRDLSTPTDNIAILLADRANSIRYRQVTEFEITTDP